MMSISTDYQFLQAAAFGELSEMQSLVKNRAANHLNVEAIDTNCSVLGDASTRFRLATLQLEPPKMNALHLSCLMGHENVIEYLITQFPILLNGRSGDGETPLLTLTRTMGLVQKVSDQCFGRFLGSCPALDSFNIGYVNCLHHLAQLEHPSKLALYLSYFASSAEDVTSALTHFLPDKLTKIIATYGNFYSKTTLPHMLDQVCVFNSTPLSNANDQTRPLLLKAAASARQTQLP
jgi:hypothetical protein